MNDLPCLHERPVTGADWRDIRNTLDMTRYVASPLTWAEQWRDEEQRTTLITLPVDAASASKEVT